MLLRSLVFVLLLAAVALADLTDAQILSALNSDRSGKELVTAKNVRILRPELEGVILVGFLTGTRGALLGTVFVDGQKMIPGDACKAVLGKLGWEKAGSADRQRLARLWVEKAQLAFEETLIDEKVPDFQLAGAPKFEKPKLESTAAGGVRLQGWIREDAGTQPGTNYRKAIYLFDADGRLVRVKMMDQYYVPSR